MNFIDAIQQNKVYNHIHHKTISKHKHNNIKINTAKTIFTKRQQSIHKELENYQDAIIKDAIISNIMSQNNIHQQIYALFAIKKQEWESLPYLNGRKKREIFIEKLQQEIKNVNRKSYNYQKHQEEIFTILGLSRKKHFNESIVKNMYIAKLQNIIIIIKGIDTEGDEDLKEVKSSSLYM